MPSPPVVDQDGARAAIERLDALDAELLAVLAQCRDAASRTHWIELARDRGVRGAAGAGLLTAEVDACAERLVEAGLVASQRPSPHRVVHRVDATVAMAALEVARDRGRLPRPQPRDGRAGSPHFEPYHDQVATLRLAVIDGDATALARALSRLYAPNRRDLLAWLITCLGPAPRIEWLRLLPAELGADHASLLVRTQWLTLRPLDPALVSFGLGGGDKQLRLEIGRGLVLAGQRCDPVDLAPLPKWGAEGVALLDAFWSGDHARAHGLGEEAVGRMKTRKTRALPDIEGICHFLAAIAVSPARPEVLHSLGQQLDAMGGPAGPPPVLAAIHAALVGERVPFEPRLGEREAEPDWLTAFVDLLHDAWLGPRPRAGSRGAERREEASRQAARLAERAAAAGYAPVARELAALAAALEGRGGDGLAGAFRPRPAWEAALVGLEAIAAGSAASLEAPPRSRELVWEVELSDDELEIRPRIREGGRARKGKSITLARLLRGEEDDLLDAADRRVLAAADQDPWARASSRWRGQLGWSAAVALIGHPRVIGADGEPIAVERGRPRLRVSRVGAMSHLEVLPSGLRGEGFAIERPAPGRLVVFEAGPELARLCEILGRRDGLSIPEEGRERLARALARLSAAVDLDVEGDVAAGARDVPADPRPVFQLGWSGAALAVGARVAPFGPDGPTVRPGAGSAVLVAEPAPGGQALRRCARDLADERRRLDAALAACPALAGMADDEHHWTAPSLEDALDVLVELADLGDDVVISWHGGQRLAVPRRADLGDLRVRVGADTDWLEVDVRLQVDEASVMRFGELLRAREGRRYVVLPRGRFLVLSDALRQHVEGFASIGSVRGEALRAPPALLPLVEELAEGTAEPSFDPAVLSRLHALRELAGQTPRVPRGFGAVLRDYQREGFEWMARLAEAGLGGCLADDMGLGKTLQALALLVHRARLGPALVVCPTSVVRHWMAEAARFASPLVVHALGEAEDRAALIGRLGPRDVLVASYGLLVSEADSLAEVAFATAVLDEAHALKNPRTQRAEAARRIRADARVALTGTPIENHLGELWSLFSTVSPGLLGTRTEFDERFAAVAAGDRAGAGRLRAILRPFLLRRLKSQVTSELPPRTEVTLRVAPYPEERAFYEALRRRAVERVAALDPRKARFHILSEITRLRQAAVDPRLLEPGGGGPPGAKLDVLMDRLGELRAEGHRALVFTQFLGSLGAVRDRLAAEGIEHHELDGSTPAAERARRIDAFQAGEGDVFLLSLRAGGTGINLTGADYVFHLDPWWNPAVEDQASDRAHRIGQERPVTVYRLVTEGTIEEKILALHDTKRQMAEDILGGLETSSSLDVNELLRLLQD